MIKKQDRMSKKFLLIPVVLFAVACGNTETDTTAPPASSTTASSSAEPVEGSPKAMGKQIAELVIANDNAGLNALIISQEEMTAVITGSSVTPMGKEVAIKNIPVELPKMRNDITNGLAEVRKQCEANGVVWENCTYKDTRYEINNPTGYNMMQLHCILDCNGMEYVFTMSDVVETKNGWKLGGTMFYGEQPPVK